VPGEAAGPDLLLGDGEQSSAEAPAPVGLLDPKILKPVLLGEQHGHEAAGAVGNPAWLQVGVTIELEADGKHPSIDFGHDDGHERPDPFRIGSPAPPDLHALRLLPPRCGT
jgi:hypothetical protein